MDDSIASIVFLLVLLFLSAFFSGSEAALFSLSRGQVRRLKSTSHTGRQVGSLLSSPRKLLITILLGNLFVNITSTSLVTSISMKVFGEKGVGYSFMLMSVLILTIGEIFPKVIGLNKPEAFARLVIYPLKFFHSLFLPVRIPLSRLTDRVIDAVKSRLGQARRFFSSGELLTALDIGLKEGDVDEFEHEILSNILEFREKVVREIMTPSIEVFALPADISREDLVDRVRRSSFSRILVYGESTDEIKGILHIKDLTRIQKGPTDPDITLPLREPYYVPESAHISDLFKELVQKKMHLAIVIDEYGSFVGIVTMEDILEELIGEIKDARDPQRTEYQLIGTNKIIVQGTMEIDKFNAVFRTNISSDEFDTIAGYVIEATGTIPNEGETFEIGSLRFHIISSEPNRVRKMKVEKL